MKTIHFTIEGKDFSIPPSYLNHSSFRIQSSPNPYEVEWLEDSDPTHSIVQAMSENPNNILLIDKNVYEIYFANIHLPSKKVFCIDAQEEIKNVHTALSVIDFLEENSFTKAETLLVVGGGIVQDIGAFVGACYKRGITWVLYPTTLLSMCDSCIGGKTGLNHNNAKNQVALFSAPTKVVLHSHFLQSLSHHDIQSGLGEIYKLLITGGEHCFALYEELVHNGTIASVRGIKKLLFTALFVKKAVIEEDEFEKKYRKSLNYGHTFGHALEILSNYAIPHGQAVALGILIVNKISYDKGYLPQKTYARLKHSAQQLIDTTLLENLPIENILSIVKKDKKVLGNNVSLVLIKDLGETIFLSTPIDDSLLHDINTIIKQEL